MRKILSFSLLIGSLLFLAACSEKAPQSAAAQKPKLQLINKSSEGKYYVDRRTQAQVFAPPGFQVDLKSAWPHWGENFLLKNSSGDFKIFLRFDRAEEDEPQAQICRAALLEGPLPGLDSSKLKMYPFLKGEFNADSIVTTDKAYPLPGLQDSPEAKANLFQIRKKGLGCYTLLFVYVNDASLAAHSTEKEILEYVRFQ